MFAFLVAIVLFVGSFVLFGYAFEVGDGANIALFTAGIVMVSLSFVIPFHLLERFD